MSKALKNSNLSGGSGTRALLVISLSAALAAFGCTTDRNIGNGTPLTTPGMRVSPTSGSASPGSETAPTTPPSMTSSSSLSAQPLPVVQRRSVRVSPAEAAAIMAQHQPRVTYLGPADPGLGLNPGSSTANGTYVTGAYQNPALRTNPQLTINSSISSPSTAAIISGAGEGVAGGTSSGAITGAATIGGTGGTPLLNNATIGANNTGLTVGGNVTGTTLSPTASSVGLPGALATTGTATSLSPTASSVVNPPTTISSFPALAATTTVTQNANGTATTTGTTRTSRVGNSTATGTATATPMSNTGAMTNPVRIITGANGRVTITNQSTSGRSQ